MNSVLDNTPDTTSFVLRNEILEISTDQIPDDTFENDIRNKIPSEHIINNDWGEIVDHIVINGDDLFTDAYSQSKKYIVHENEKNEKELKQKILEHLDIDDIKSLDIKSKEDLELLEKASMIAKNLKFQFNKRHEENNEKFIVWMNTSLIWLHNVMIELAKRNNQPLTNVQQSNNKYHTISTISTSISTISMSTSSHSSLLTITRNSYKFCEFGYSCKFNYDIKERCYAQHYVFNLVAQDIADTLKFITDTITNSTFTSTSNIGININELIEIRTSINTITFVINHMYDELLQLKNTNRQHYDNYIKRIYKYRTTNIKRKKSKKLLGIHG